MWLYLSENLFAADLKLYKYFQQKFDNKVKSFGKEKIRKQILIQEKQNVQMKVLYFVWNI